MRGEKEEEEENKTSIEGCVCGCLQGITSTTTELARKSTSLTAKTPLAQAALMTLTGETMVQFLQQQQPQPHKRGATPICMEAVPLSIAQIVACLLFNGKTWLQRKNEVSVQHSS